MAEQGRLDVGSAFVSKKHTGVFYTLPSSRLGVIQLLFLPIRQKFARSHYTGRLHSRLRMAPPTQIRVSMVILLTPSTLNVGLTLGGK